MEGPKTFCDKALELHDEFPKTVVTDGLASYPWGIKEAEYEVYPYTENLVEPSHRSVKHRYYLITAFGGVDSAERFCRVMDDVANVLGHALKWQNRCVYRIAESSLFRVLRN